MKKYIKPIVREVCLNTSVLIATSGPEKTVNIDSDNTASSFEILSNKESENDIWGNGDSIW